MPVGEGAKRTRIEDEEAMPTRVGRSITGIRQGLRWKGAKIGFMTFSEVAGFREVARERLAGFPYTMVADTPGVRRAAVALCVVADDDGVPAVIVIRRAYRGRNAGQWGLPGGGVDARETPEQAALRELHEEIGLAALPEDVLGRLDDFPASSGFAITPVVVVPDAPGPLRPSPAEVHSVHLVPLGRLAAADTPRWVPQHEALPQAMLRAQPDVERPGDSGPRLLQMRLADDMVIHAPTGAMLWQFREVVLLGRPAEEARVADFLQPDWTHR
jgi:8-oxo-dGTP pyrophosphatase MutT (NUDIX family)